jgi:hypothetical protein
VKHQSRLNIYLSKFFSFESQEPTDRNNTWIILFQYRWFGAQIRTCTNVSKIKCDIFDTRANLSSFMDFIEQLTTRYFGMCCFVSLKGNVTEGWSKGMYNNLIYNFQLVNLTSNEKSICKCDSYFHRLNYPLCWIRNCMGCKK